jgi:hypothetical protein
MIPSGPTAGNRDFAHVAPNAFENCDATTAKAANAAWLCML